MPGPALTSRCAAQDNTASIARLLTPVRVVCLGIFLHVFDMGAAVMTLPVLRAADGFSGSSAANVITLYYAAALALMPLSGWLVERFGARLVFLAACLLFALGAGVSATAVSGPLLGLGRAIQGLGGGLLVPVGRAAALGAHGRGDILRVIASLSVPALIAPLIAPVVAGLLIDTAGWRVLFALSATLGLAIATAGLLGLPPKRRTVEILRRPFDFPGYGLLLTGLLLLLLTSEVLMRGTIGWAAAVLLLLPCAACGVAFRRRSLRHPSPVLDMTLFTHRRFAISIYGGLLARLSLGAVPVLVTLLLGAARQPGPLVTGVLLVVPTLGSLLVKSCIQPLARGTGPRSGILLGGAVSAVLVAALPVVADYSLWALAATLFVLGFARSAMLTLVTSVTFQDLAPERMADGSAIASLAQQLSIMAGLHVAVALGTMARSEILPGVSPLTLAAMLIAGLSAVALLPLRRLPADDVPAPARRQGATESA